jgi:hypothetical protein
MRSRRRFLCHAPFPSWSLAPREIQKSSYGLPAHDYYSRSKIGFSRFRLMERLAQKGRRALYASLFTSLPEVNGCGR